MEPDGAEDWVDGLTLVGCGTLLFIELGSAIRLKLNP